MTVYKVRLCRSAMLDMDALEEYLKGVMSQLGANKYIDNMIAEVMSLAVYADLYKPSQMADIRKYHPGQGEWSAITNDGFISFILRTIL